MPTLTIDLRNFENILNPVYVPDLYKKERYLVLFGGSGSGKSHFACQKILYRTLKEEGHRFLVVRKVARTLRHSVFQLFLNYITEWGIYDLFQIHKSEMTITFKANGNSILFVGVDDPVKLKSIEGVTGVWIEEADELALPDFEEIDRRLRAVFHTYMQIILTYNPVLKSNWTYPRFFGDPPTTKNIAVRKTNYKDNVFIQDDTAYIELLEGYEGNKRRVFTEGEYGFLEHAIYSKWRTIPDSKFPTEDEAIGGLDFGFINPNCLLKIVIDIEEKKVYIDEMIYKRRQTTPMLVANMRELGIPEDMLIVADSEAPDKIKEIQESGFRYVLKSKKGPGSVISGIDAVQQFELLITESSVNVKREIEMYQRRVDKDGNVLEEPEKGLDHAMDALRYPVHYYYRVGVRKGTMA